MNFWKTPVLLLEYTQKMIEEKILEHNLFSNSQICLYCLFNFQFNFQRSVAVVKSEDDLMMESLPN